MARGPFKRRVKEPISAFGGKFEPALRQFSADFLKSQRFKHAQTKGVEREVPVQEFFREHLPGAYEVTSGEVVDLKENHSPQLDLLIYDKLRNFSFYSGQSAILPAEALLVSLEVKSLLTKQEVEKSVKAAAKLRELKPYKKPLFEGGRGAEPHKPQCRYFHCLFAYNTDISEGGWVGKEYDRLVKVTNQSDASHIGLDRVYVADRGVINPKDKVGMVEEHKSGNALMVFYMHILNFLVRENSRREPVDYLEYAGRMSEGWQNL